MDNIISQLIVSFLEVSPLLVLFSEDWGSKAPGHRLSLRQSLKAQLEKLKLDEGDLSSLLDLNQRPQLPSVNISISHTLDMGGFIVTSKTTPIGLDIEVSERVSDEVIKRVSSGLEVDLAPSNAALWVAKESAFKAFPDTLQPSLISKLDITKWESLKNGNTFKFAFSCKQNKGLTKCGSGIVGHFNCLNVGISTLSS